MNWQRGIEIRAGETWETTTNLCEISVSYEKDDHQGILYYTRPRFEEPEVEDPYEETIIFETRADSVTLDFTPLYPERPVVFTLEEPLKIPPGQKGFFCLTFRVAIGVTITRSDTVIERLLPEPRKNSYWGPPNNGLLTFREKSNLYESPENVMLETDTTTVVVPVYYLNQREEGDLVTNCLVPLQELDLYVNEQDDLIFEVVKLNHRDEFYQEPTPLKRPPKEMKQAVNHYQTAPSDPKSLFEQVTSLPKLTQFTSLFLNR